MLVETIVTTTAACIFRLSEPIYSIDRNVFSFTARLLGCAWFLCVLWRTFAACEDFSFWSPLFFPPTEVQVQKKCLPQDAEYFPVAQVAYYVSELAWLFWQHFLDKRQVDKEAKADQKNKKRKDEWLLVTHHFITLFLIGYFALYKQLTWAALVIPVAHDVGDVFLDAAKFAKSKNQTAVSNSLFVVFFLVWCVTRLYYVPMQYFENIDFLLGHPSLAYRAGGAAIGLLLCAQLYWTWLILKAIYRSIIGGKEIEDEREAE